MSPIRAWLQLVRLPAIFTAWSNIGVGYLLTHPHLLPVQNVLLLMISTTGLYLAGMSFNDYFDRQIDLEERPFRPIPSGAISAKAALIGSCFLMGTGLTAAWLVSLTSGFLAMAICVAVLAYDGGLKKTFVGPIVMGSCRTLNILLGASLAGNLTEEPIALLVSLGLGLYVCGLTWFGRNEVEESSTTQLKLSTFFITLVGAAFVILLLTGPPLNWQLESAIDETLPTHRMVAVAGLLSVFFLIGRKLFSAIQRPGPSQVQQAMKTMLMSILLFDAIFILAFNGCYGYALATAALMIPARLIGRRLYIT